MAETRVDLKHLLEDIRDGYSCPIEEAILTELVANALDSGCSRIDIRIEPEQKRLTFTDNGEGMNRQEFVKYHDIASTAKVRGKGIGFAGVGAKLALLVCREVITETRRARSCLCSRWWLESSFRAPWEDVGELSIVPEKGTGVRLHFHDREAANLLRVDYVAQAIRDHFYPLLDAEFTKVLSHIYPCGITIAINGEPVALSTVKREAGEYFIVRRGKRKKLMGIGFLLKTADDLPEERRGLAVSTFGKVIRRGWEWLGITPKNPNRLTGVVEVPELVEVLNTTKSDFMKDPNSLQKYYNARKVIQHAAMDLLDTLGETRTSEQKTDKGLERLRKEIDRVVGEILPDFPELAPLFGRKKRGDEVSALLSDSQGPVATDVAEGADFATGDKGGPGEGGGVEESIEGPLAGEHLEAEEGGDGQAKEHAIRRKRPGLMIGIDQETGGNVLGWLRENTIDINALHPAYKRVETRPEAGVYIIFAVASVLSVHVQEKRAPLEFLHRFMAAWGETA